MSGIGVASCGVEMRGIIMQQLLKTLSRMLSSAAIYLCAQAVRIPFHECPTWSYSYHDMWCRERELESQTSGELEEE